MAHGGEWIDEDVWVPTFNTGHIAALNSQKPVGRQKKKAPIGFAPPLRKTRKVTLSGGRPAGTFPDVPHFDQTP